MRAGRSGLEAAVVGAMSLALSAPAVGCADRLAAPGSPPEDAGRPDAPFDAAAAETGPTDAAPDGASPRPRCTLASTPSWTIVGEPASQLGNAVATLDADGDGDLDLVVGAWYWRPEGALSPQGRVLLFETVDGALETQASWVLSGQLGDRDGTGDTVLSSYLGTALASAGDVDGDGFEDLLVGEPYSAQSATGDARASARVLLFPGSPTGLSPSPAWTFEPDEPRLRLGPTAAGAGDVDADGFDDVIVGAHRTGVWGTGRAALFPGSSAGLSAEPAWTIVGEDRRDDVGRTVGGAGDLNADGFADVFVTSCGVDKVAAYLGGPEGLTAEPVWVLYGADGSCGVAASAGDADGDGDSDLAAVVLTQTTEVPQVSLYLGEAQGLPPDAITTLAFEPAAVPLPGGFALAGDANGDGFDDLAIYSELASPELRNQGMVAIHPGGAAGWDADVLWTRAGSASSERLGTAVAALPDADAPGCTGLVVTSSFFAGPLAEMGRVEWYRPVRVR